MDDDSSILCFNPANDQGTLYYKLSTDNGITWSDTAKKILASGYRFDDHTIVSTGPDSLICTSKLKRTLYSNYNIYARNSTNNGLTWGDTVNISGYGNNNIMPRVSKDDSGILWLAYVRTETISFGQFSNYTVGDVYYRKSTNGGLTWSDEAQFTHYIGDDNHLSLNTSGTAPFVTYSTIKFTGNYQVAYGVLDETTESSTPPCLFGSYSLWSNDPDNIIFRAYVKDDNQVESVKLYFEDSMQVSQLYDDGLHEDLEAEDGVFGNELAYNITQHGNAVYINVNKLKIPFSNKGVIAGLQIRDTSNTTFLLCDIENNLATTLQRIVINIGSTGRYEEGSFLFSSGFFLSGFANGELWANGVAPSSLVQDYLPGTVGSNPDDPLFNFYVIHKDDTPFGFSWIKWKDAVLLGADFYDGDKDGIYNPVDKNWNSTWDPNEDMPPLLGDEIVWCVSCL